MEDIAVLNKILYDFIYETDDPCIEDFYLVDNFKSIILDNPTKLKPSNYHHHVSLDKSIKHSYDFLKTIDKSYADKLMANIENGSAILYPRIKGDTTNAQIQIDAEANRSKILIPYDRTIEDTYTITHEQLHDTNMDPNNLNTTCSLFTEMISFLGELLQRDYFEKQNITPKEYRNNMKDSFYATRNYAVSMNMELDLIKRFLNKGTITYQDMREICQNKTIDELEIISDKLEEILNNEEFGWSIEQREEKLTKTHKVAKVLNWTGGLIAAWVLFLPNPYEYAIIACIILPVICVIVLKYFGGLITIDERKNTAYPTIAWAIFASSIALCLRGVLDYNIFDYSKTWAPAILVTLAFIAILTIGNKEFKLNKAKSYLAILSISLFMFGYGYGAVVTLNCMYDKSQPETFSATILNKRISSGKSKTYYLKLTPWGLQKEIDEVSVSKNLYNRVGKNDEVKIYFMKGKFAIPWFEVTK